MENVPVAKKHSRSMATKTRTFSNESISEDFDVTEYLQVPAILSKTKIVSTPLPCPATVVTQGVKKKEVFK